MGWREGKYIKTTPDATAGKKGTLGEKMGMGKVKKENKKTNEGPAGRRPGNDPGPSGRRPDGRKKVDSRVE